MNTKKNTDEEFLKNINKTISRIGEQITNELPASISRQSKPQFLKYTPKKTKQPTKDIYSELQKDIEQALINSSRYRVEDKRQNHKLIAVGDDVDELYEKLQNHPSYPTKGSSTTGIKKGKSTFEKDLKAAIKNLGLITSGKTPVSKTITSTQLYGNLELYDRINLLGNKPSTPKRTLKPLIDKYKVNIPY